MSHIIVHVIPSLLWYISPNNYIRVIVKLWYHNMVPDVVLCTVIYVIYLAYYNTVIYITDMWLSLWYTRSIISKCQVYTTGMDSDIWIPGIPDDSGSHWGLENYEIMLTQGLPCDAYCRGGVTATMCRNLRIRLKQECYHWLRLSWCVSILVSPAKLHKGHSVISNRQRRGNTRESRRVMFKLHNFRA